MVKTRGQWKAGGEGSERADKARHLPAMQRVKDTSRQGVKDVKEISQKVAGVVPDPRRAFRWGALSGGQSVNYVVNSTSLDAAAVPGLSTVST